MHWKFDECLSSRSVMKKLMKSVEKVLIISCFHVFVSWKCFKYCLGDSPVTHKTFLFILVSQNLNACEMLRY